MRCHSPGGIPVINLLCDQRTRRCVPVAARVIDGRLIDVAALELGVGDQAVPDHALSLNGNERRRLWSLLAHPLPRATFRRSSTCSTEPRHDSPSDQFPHQIRPFGPAKVREPYCVAVIIGAAVVFGVVRRRRQPLAGSAVAG